MTHRPALFAAVLGLGRAASNIGDHWIQNDHCARVKAATDAKPVLMPAAARVLGIRLHPGAAAAALALSGITHYVADRRVPGGVLEQLATKTGKGNFFRLADHGLNGAYALDQAWHGGWEAVAALIATTKATSR